MTDRYAVIGNPLGHTKSPQIHADFARQTGEDLMYEALEVPLDGFATALAAFRAAGGRGANVTAPFKLEALAIATQPTERARLAGAANALMFEDGVVLADNFDGVGLARDIQENLGFRFGDRRVLLMGAGGAARGAMHSILEQRPAVLAIANRTVSKAVGLRWQFRTYPQIVAGGYRHVADQPFDLIINATSASLFGQLPDVPATAFGDGCLAYELAYGNGATPFLRFAGESGAGRLADGTGMLVEQAAESFAWWRGLRPATLDLIATLAIPIQPPESK